MINALVLRDFRNYKEACITFSPKINVIYGDNAQGKTNLLEAIYLLISGRSFRTAHLQDLIRFGADSFYLEALFKKDGIEQTLRFFFDRNGKKIIYNSTVLPSVSSLLGILNGIVLSPEDRSLIKGNPATRRHFLDLLIAQSNPLYLHHLSRYSKAMKQRNTLLRQRSLHTIEVWEEQMAPSAAFLTNKRAQTVKELETLSQTETLASDKLNLSYRSSALSKGELELDQMTQYFLNQFKKQRFKECELGLTLSGPHRDDVSILVHEKQAHKFASEGQQRSCIAALKLSQWKWMSRLISEKPLLCIDDIGVSFDTAREHQLYQRMHNFGQVFVTSTSIPPVTSHSICVERGSFIS